MGSFRQALSLGIIGVADMKFHTRMPVWYRQIRKMSSWSGEQIKDWQLRMLQRLVCEAYEHSVYYRGLFEELRLRPSDIKCFEDLEIIPPLTKEIIKERFDDILLDNSSKYHFSYGSTGGSSGVPLRYVKDNESWGFDNGFMLWMWQRTGYRYGDRYLALGSASIFPVNKTSVLHKMYYSLKNKVPFNAMDVSDSRLSECVDLITRQNIHYIYGYASSIYMLAKYVIRENIRDRFSVKACFPTSELLTDEYYRTIYDAFHCQIMNGYGANDGGIIGFRLNRESGFKLGYNCIAQVNYEESRTHDEGPVLVTDLTNLVFPFIRYDLGDIVKLAGGYNDFHNGQVLEDVVGRKSDVIELENGHVLTCPGFTILFKDLHIKGYRMFKTGALEIVVDVVKDKGFVPSEEVLIVETIKKYSGQDCKVSVTYSEQLSRRENGKMFYYEK